MKATSQLPPQVAPEQSPRPAVPAHGSEPRIDVAEGEYDERMRAALVERATRPVPATVKRRFDTGYADIVAAARSGGPGTAAPTRTPAPVQAKRKDGASIQVAPEQPAMGARGDAGGLGSTQRRPSAQPRTNGSTAAASAPVQPRVDPGDGRSVSGDDHLADQDVPEEAEVAGGPRPELPPGDPPTEPAHRLLRNIAPSPADPPAPSREAPAVVAEALRSPGRPLDPTTRSFFEARLGSGISAVKVGAQSKLIVGEAGDRYEREADRVAREVMGSHHAAGPPGGAPRVDLRATRIHTDATAASSARAIHARAYTVGQNIVFAEGQYQPDTREGRALLAHELTHVVQQGAATAGAPLVQRDGEDKPVGAPPPDATKIVVARGEYLWAFIPDSVVGFFFNAEDFASWKPGERERIQRDYYLKHFWPSLSEAQRDNIYDAVEHTYTSSGWTDDEIRARGYWLFRVSWPVHQSFIEFIKNRYQLDPLEPGEQKAGSGSLAGGKGDRLHGPAKGKGKTKGKPGLSSSGKTPGSGAGAAVGELPEGYKEAVAAPDKKLSEHEQQMLVWVKEIFGILATRYNDPVRPTLTWSNFVRFYFTYSSWFEGLIKLFSEGQRATLTPDQAGGLLAKFDGFMTFMKVVETNKELLARGRTIFEELKKKHDTTPPDPRLTAKAFDSYVLADRTWFADAVQLAYIDKKLQLTDELARKILARFHGLGELTVESSQQAQEAGEVKDYGNLLTLFEELRIKAVQKKIDAKIDYDVFFAFYQKNKEYVTRFLAKTAKGEDITFDQMIEVVNKYKEFEDVHKYYESKGKQAKKLTLDEYLSTTPKFGSDKGWFHTEVAEQFVPIAVLHTVPATEERTWLFAAGQKIAFGVSFTGSDWHNTWYNIKPQHATWHWKILFKKDRSVLASQNVTIFAAPNIFNVDLREFPFGLFPSGSEFIVSVHAVSPEFRLPDNTWPVNRADGEHEFTVKASSEVSKEVFASNYVQVDPKDPNPDPSKIFLRNDEGKLVLKDPAATRPGTIADQVDVIQKTLDALNQANGRDAKGQKIRGATQTISDDEYRAGIEYWTKIRDKYQEEKDKAQVAVGGATVEKPSYIVRATFASRDTANAGALQNLTLVMHEWAHTSDSSGHTIKLRLVDFSNNTERLFTYEAVGTGASVEAAEAEALKAIRQRFTEDNPYPLGSVTMAVVLRAGKNAGVVDVGTIPTDTFRKEFHRTLKDVKETVDEAAMVVGVAALFIPGLQAFAVPMLTISAAALTLTDVALNMYQRQLEGHLRFDTDTVVDLVSVAGALISIWGLPAVSKASSRFVKGMYLIVDASLHLGQGILIGHSVMTQIGGVRAQYAGRIAMAGSEAERSQIRKERDAVIASIEADAVKQGLMWGFNTALKLLPAAHALGKLKGVGTFQVHEEIYAAIERGDVDALRALRNHPELTLTDRAVLQDALLGYKVFGQKGLSIDHLKARLELRLGAGSAGAGAGTGGTAAPGQGKLMDLPPEVVAKLTPTEVDAIVAMDRRVRAAHGKEIDAEPALAEYYKKWLVHTVTGGREGSPPGEPPAGARAITDQLPRHLTSALEDVKAQVQKDTTEAEAVSKGKEVAPPRPASADARPPTEKAPPPELDAAAMKNSTPAQKKMGEELDAAIQAQDPRRFADPEFSAYYKAWAEHRFGDGPAPGPVPKRFARAFAALETTAGRYARAAETADVVAKVREEHGGKPITDPDVQQALKAKLGDEAAQKLIDAAATSSKQLRDRSASLTGDQRFQRDRINALFDDATLQGVVDTFPEGSQVYLSGGLARGGGEQPGAIRSLKDVEVLVVLPEGATAETVAAARAKALAMAELPTKVAMTANGGKKAVPANVRVLTPDEFIGSLVGGKAARIDSSGVLVKPGVPGAPEPPKGTSELPRDYLARLKAWASRAREAGEDPTRLLLDSGRAPRPPTSGRKGEADATYQRAAETWRAALRAAGLDGDVLFWGNVTGGGSSSGGTRGKGVYATDYVVEQKGMKLGVGPKDLQQLVDAMPRERTGVGYKAEVKIDSGTTKIEFEHAGAKEKGVVVTGKMTVTDPAGNVLGTVDLTARSTRKFTVGEAHAEETGPARLDLVPPDVANGRPNWKATIEMDMHTRPEDVKFVIGHELDEAAAIVSKRATDPAQIAAEGQPRVMKENATDIDAKHATSHDQAHVKEIDALSADHDAAAAKIKAAQDTIEATAAQNEKIKQQNQQQGTNKPLETTSAEVTPEMLAAERAKAVRLRKALEITGLSDPVRFAARKQMLRDLGMSETRVNRLETIVHAAEFTRSALHPGMQATHPSIVESTIDHLLHPSLSEKDFKDAGINGGHSDQNLQAWLNLKGNEKYAIEPQKSSGDFIEYRQYEWKGSPPAPTAAADRPGGANAQIGPTGWDPSLQVKTTTTNMQKFLADAEVAWEGWRQANYAPGPPPTGAATAPKNLFRFQAPSGVVVEGVFVYTPGTGSPPAPSWTLITVYPKL